MDLLERGLEELGLSDERRTEVLRVYIGEIERWNGVHNLVRAAGDELIIRHILDSLAPLPLLRPLLPREIADVGSGAGFPGVPLAIWTPESRFYFIEKMGKRSGFLRNVKALCRLDNAEVIQRSVDDFDGTVGLAVFRALGNFESYLPKIAGILEPGGIAAAYKGKRSTVEGELTRLPAEWDLEALHQLSVPFLAEERHLLLLRYCKPVS